MTAIDLFAGADGWSHGDRAVGIENDPLVCQTRRAAGCKTIQNDVTRLDPRMIGAKVLDFFKANHLQGITASSPCTPFSMAGNRYGYADREILKEEALRIAGGNEIREREWADDRSPLSLEPLRWVLALEPEWTAWENVQGLADYFDACAHILKRRGYNVWTGLVQANDYGVAQTRRRCILLASREHPVAKPPPTEPGLSMADVMPGLKGRAVALRMGSRQARGTRRTIDQPAPTIAFGKSSSGVVWELADGTERTITVEQAAVLQGFPRDYPFQGGKVATFSQIGDAVPPPMGRAIVESVVGGVLIG